MLSQLLLVTLAKRALLVRIRFQARAGVSVVGKERTPLPLALLLTIAFPVRMDHTVTYWKLRLASLARTGESPTLRDLVAFHRVRRVLQASMPALLRTAVPLVRWARTPLLRVPLALMFVIFARLDPTHHSMELRHVLCVLLGRRAL